MQVKPLQLLRPYPIYVFRPASILYFLTQTLHERGLWDLHTRASQMLWDSAPLPNMPARTHLKPMSLRAMPFSHTGTEKARGSIWTNCFSFLHPSLLPFPVFHHWANFFSSPYSTPGTVLWAPIKKMLGLRNWARRWSGRARKRQRD